MHEMQPPHAAGWGAAAILVGGYSSEGYDYKVCEDTSTKQIDV